jgi:hypothetical protein
MAAYTGYLFPVPGLVPQFLSTSLTAGVDRPHAYEIGDPAILGEPWSASTSGTPCVGTPRVTHSLTAYVQPTWADYLFGNILLVPPRLDLGNILSSQQRAVEIANLYLTSRSWTAAVNAIAGLTLNNLPTFPDTIRAFGSFVLQIGIAADGPASISGSVELDFDVVTLFLPVTGKRIVLWQFAPVPPIIETPEWKTDVLEAWDGTEQRMGLRAAPRQRIAMTHTKFDAIEGRIRALAFDWLARPFAVPIWWEARGLTSSAAPGDTTIYVPTDSADFEVGNLVMIYTSDSIYEAFELATINPSSLVLTAQIANAYPGGTLVMPMRTAYAKTVPTQPRVKNDASSIGVEFTTITTTNLADLTGSTMYQSKVLMDDPNLFQSSASDSWDRPVVVNDSNSGRILQTSTKDRSRYRTGKAWDAPNRAAVWRVRRLLHALAGSRTSFFLPTFRNDLTLTQPIGASSTTVQIAECGYTTYFKSRRPFADIRITRRNGTSVTRQVIGAVLDVSGLEEVLTVDSYFDAANIINPDDVVRIDFVNMVRIADDQATFTHRRLGDATISVNLVSCKE